MKMPVLFVGHGSPMNALAHNEFTRSLQGLGSQLPKPSAILVISAHWESEGTQLLNHPAPPTIHDFYGFPKELFEITYPAPGSPTMAQETQKLLHNMASLTNNWGFDHGTWSVLVHLYPQAQIPVYQLSLNRRLNFAQHYALAQELKSLREQGVLILGSGNIVHNLRLLEWQKPQQGNDWSIEFDDCIQTALSERQFDKIISPEKFFPRISSLAIPTPEHYLPLLYIAALSDDNEKLSFPFEGFDLGSLSMRSVLWQPA